jgi:signal transduction histidine kinase
MMTVLLPQGRFVPSGSGPVPTAREPAASGSDPLSPEAALEPADADPTFPDTTSTRLAATVRLICFFAAAQIILAGSTTAGVPALVPLVLLFLFAVYAGSLYVRTVRHTAFVEPQWSCWTDALWYLAIIGVTGGAKSHISFFLPFPVLFVSLRWGFASGINLTFMSAGSLCALYLLMGEWQNGVVDALLPSVALTVLGYLIATWANSNLAMNRRLASLKDIHALFSPRLNLDQVVDRTVRHLARLYPIERYVLVVADARGRTRVYRSDFPGDAYRVSDVAADELGDALVDLGSATTALYRASRGLRKAELRGIVAPDPRDVAGLLDRGTATALRLACRSFGALKFALREGGSARVYICVREGGFSPADMPFLRQLEAMLAGRIENIELLDRLAREVAEHERHKISRDMHDSAIQPYIGLKFALEALDRKAAPDGPLSKDISRLVEMANLEIVEMRRFVKGLRGQGEAGQAALIPAIRRQAARFGELYGIQVTIDVTGEPGVDDRLADEAFHIVSEGLSNIRRHTAAATARIDVACDDRKLVLRIANPTAYGTSPKLFTPRSIFERTHSLNGQCRVESLPGRDTVVVELPLTH